MKIHPILKGFINTGLDSNIYKSILLKSQSHEGQTQRLVTVHGKHSTFQRLQWVNLSDSNEHNIFAGFKTIKEYENKLVQLTIERQELIRMIQDNKKFVSYLYSRVKECKNIISKLKKQERDTLKNLQSVTDNTKKTSLKEKLKQIRTKLNYRQNEELTSLTKRIDIVINYKKTIIEKLNEIEEKRTNTVHDINLNRKALQEYLYQYQKNITPISRETGLHTDDPMSTEQEQQEYDNFRKTCADRYKVITEPKTGYKVGFRTQIGQLITGVDAKHLFRRSKERGFSLEDIEYILQFPQFITDGGITRDEETGEEFHSLKYVTATRAVVVSRSGIIKTCMNLPVGPPKNYSRWILRGWDYASEDLKEFKKKWYTELHPNEGWEERDRFQDERWLDVWKRRGFDMTTATTNIGRNRNVPLIQKDENGNPIRDEYGHYVYSNSTAAVYEFNKFIKNWTKMINNRNLRLNRPLFDLDLDYHRHFPEEFIYENDRQSELREKSIGDEYYNEARKQLKRNFVRTYDTEDFQYYQTVIREIIDDIKRQPRPKSNFKSKPKSSIRTDKNTSNY